MRVATFALGLAACSPEIASGSYFCGPEQACPSDQACSGEGVCVVPAEVRPFACDTGTDPEPDDTAAQASALPALGCVSNPAVKAGCLHAGDPTDWFSLATPAACSQVQVQVRITFSIAFEPLALELWDLGANTKIADDAECPGSGSTSMGDDDRCIQMTVSPGGGYGIAVKPAGGGDCGGSCDYNRYTLTVQLATPG